MNLRQYGWSEFFENSFTQYERQGFHKGRITAEHKGRFDVATEIGIRSAEVTGKLMHTAASSADFPAVGDWVALKIIESGDTVMIHAVLERKSKFSRTAPGLGGADKSEQVVAANIDTVMLMTSLNKDFNLRRLERYLTMAWEGGVRPVFVLNKADLCNDVPAMIAEVESIAWGVPIHPISAEFGQGIEDIHEYFQGSQTIALLGSSGVGKTTLLNALAGSQLMKTGAIGSYKDKGQHTTTHRQLTLLENGGLLIDTPGMRELQMWEGSEGVEQTFSDIEDLASECRFSNCTHETEPDCAIQGAIDSGELAEERYWSYLKLQREIAYQLRRKARSSGRRNRRR